jgi:triacylglycerol lipase
MPTGKKKSMSRSRRSTRAPRNVISYTQTAFRPDGRRRGNETKLLDNNPRNNREFLPFDLPLWKESFLGFDMLRLCASRVLCGRGIARGDGSAVVLVPGFMASDIYLTTMYNWFRRIGYRPYMSQIGRNADCPNILVRYLLDTVERAKAETGRKVHLVGHSLGGVLSRTAAAFRPELIASVTMLGSPIRGIRVHPWILSLSDIVHHKVQLSSLFKPFHERPEHPSCYTAACACGFACSWRGEFPAEKVPQLAVFTKSDGVVDWQVCLTGDPKYDVEVSGTHCGLVWNPEVYQLVAERMLLASNRGSVRKSHVSRARTHRSSARSRSKAANL